MLDEGVPMLKTEEGSKFAIVNLRVHKPDDNAKKMKKTFS